MKLPFCSCFMSASAGEGGEGAQVDVQTVVAASNKTCSRHDWDDAKDGAAFLLGISSPNPSRSPSTRYTTSVRQSNNGLSCCTSLAGNPELGRRSGLSCATADGGRVQGVGGALLQPWGSATHQDVAVCKDLHSACDLELSSCSTPPGIHISPDGNMKGSSGEPKSSGWNAARTCPGAPRLLSRTHLLQEMPGEGAGLGAVLQQQVSGSGIGAAAAAAVGAADHRAHRSSKSFTSGSELSSPLVACLVCGASSRVCVCVWQAHVRGPSATTSAQPAPAGACLRRLQSRPGSVVSFSLPAEDAAGITQDSNPSAPGDDKEQLLRSMSIALQVAEEMGERVPMAGLGKAMLRSLDVNEELGKHAGGCMHNPTSERSVRGMVNSRSVGNLCLYGDAGGSHVCSPPSGQHRPSLSAAAETRGGLTKRSASQGRLVGDLAHRLRSVSRSGAPQSPLRCSSTSLGTPSGPPSTALQRHGISISISGACKPLDQARGSLGVAQAPILSEVGVLLDTEELDAAEEYEGVTGAMLRAVHSIASVAALVDTQTTAPTCIHTSPCATVDCSNLISDPGRADAALLQLAAQPPQPPVSASQPHSQPRAAAMRQILGGDSIPLPRSIPHRVSSLPVGTTAPMPQVQTLGFSGGGMAAKSYQVMPSVQCQSSTVDRGLRINTLPSELRELGASRVSPHSMRQTSGAGTRMASLVSQSMSPLSAHNTPASARSDVLLLKGQDKPATAGIRSLITRGHSSNWSDEAARAAVQRSHHAMSGEWVQQVNAVRRSYSGCALDPSATGPHSATQPRSGHMRMYAAVNLAACGTGGGYKAEGATAGSAWPECIPAASPPSASGRACPVEVRALSFFSPKARQGR